MMILIKITFIIGQFVKVLTFLNLNFHSFHSSLTKIKLTIKIKFFP